MPIHWRSTPQPKTVYSPATAEIYGLREGVREAQALQWLCRDMGMSGVLTPFIMQVDNQQAISFQQDTCVRTRHRGVIDMAEAWVAELKDQSKVVTKKVAGLRNPADLLTKCLDWRTFEDRKRLFHQAQLA